MTRSQLSLLTKLRLLNLLFFTAMARSNIPPSEKFRSKRQLKAPPWAIDAWQVNEFTRDTGGPVCLGTYFDLDTACAAADAAWLNGIKRRSIYIGHVCGVLNDGKFYRCHFQQTKFVGQAPEAETYTQLKESLDRINAAIAALPTFAIIHEGGIEAATTNIVESIAAATRKLEALNV